MKAISFVFSSFVLLAALAVKAEGGGGNYNKPSLSAVPSTTKKSQFNSQIYEKESSQASFSAQVKVVREVQGETEVFFAGQPGFFVLNMSGPNAGSSQTLLVASQSKKFNVQVTIDTVSRQILSVARSGE